MNNTIDTTNRLDFDKAIAHKTPEQFRKMNCPYFVHTLYEYREDENGNKVKTNRIINRFVRELVGPRNADGTVPPTSQGDTLAYVATNWKKDEESVFAAFRDDAGDIKWILMNRPAGLDADTEFVFE